MATMWVTLLSLWSSFPPLLRGLLVLGAGALAAQILGWVLSAALKAMRIDRLGESAGLADFLKKGGVAMAPSALFGRALRLLILLGTLVYSIREVDGVLYASLLGSLAQAIPTLLATVLIVVIGTMVTIFLSNFARTLALNAAFPYARALAGVLKAIGIVLSLTAGLEHLGVGRIAIETLFLLLGGTAALGAAIAFGLGCKDLARDAFRRTIEDLREKERLGSRSDLEG